MNWDALPPLSSLRAFAAYAETGSVTAAGARLNVSHAAISQQIRSLETHLGIGLLDRNGRRMALSADGQALAKVVRNAFEHIAETVEALTGADADRALHIACTPSFASNWLMPRLARFRAANPDIDMMIDPNPALTDPAPGGVDAAIRYGAGPWPGLEQTKLMSAPLVVVGAPQLFPDGLPETPDALLNLPWIQELGTNETSRWLEARGVSVRRANAITHVPGNLMIDGARQGQGIAVTTRLAVEQDLAAGTLIVAFQDEANTGYNLLMRPGVARPPLAAFAKWIKREVKKVD